VVPPPRPALKGAADRDRLADHHPNRGGILLREVELNFADPALRFGIRGGDGAEQRIETQHKDGVRLVAVPNALIVRPARIYAASNVSPKRNSVALVPVTGRLWCGSVADEQT
jgi:hypothetical protein